MVTILIPFWFDMYMQGGSRLASNIQFKHIEMNDVIDPIIVEQNYCDKPKKPKISTIIKYKLYYLKISKPHLPHCRWHLCPTCPRPFKLFFLKIFVILRAT